MLALLFLASSVKAQDANSTDKKQGQAPDGLKALKHPELGKMWFEHSVFKLEDSPEQRLILYSPLPKCNTPEKVEQLLELAPSTQ